jgi:signal peptidase I
MEPTLLPGDDFFVDKTILRHRDPARGDVVVFWVTREGSRVFPVDQRPDLPTEKFVKRIIGLPRDRLSIVSEQVIVNGAQVPDKPLGRTVPDSEGNALDVFEEVLGGRGFMITHDPNRNGKDMDPFLVPENRYFLLGDNREESNDSRYWGTVPRTSIIGIVTHVYFSWDPVANGIRWTRFGQLIP